MRSDGTRSSNCTIPSGTRTRRAGAFLRQACAGDEELRREVESLLSYETETAMFLDRPALEVAARALAVDRRNGMIGRTLGHYRSSRGSAPAAWEKSIRP